MGEELYIELPTKEYLCGHLAKPQKMVPALNETMVLFLHNFPGNQDGSGGVFKELQDSLSAQNIASLRFDFRHCGKSDGKPTDFSLQSALDDVKTVLVWIEGQGYRRVIIVGEGLGALFCVCLSDLPSCVKGCAMLWPALNVPIILNEYYGVKKQAVLLEEHGYLRHGDYAVGQGFVKDLENLPLQRKMKEFSLPTLALHGTNDNVISFENIEKVRRFLGARRIDIVSFEGGGHGLDKPAERKALSTHIFHFAERFARK